MDYPANLFEWANHASGKPKTKTQTCNQLECKNKVTLKLDQDEGIYIGNRTCSECRRAFRFKYAECW